MNSTFMMMMMICDLLLIIKTLNDKVSGKTSSEESEFLQK